MSISDLRQSYENAPPLRQCDCPPLPMPLLRQWFDDAWKADILEPNAFTLATIGDDGAPDARVVLMKDLTEEGLSFFTHYTSQKGRQIEAQPRVSAVFYWDVCFRSVRIYGRIEKVTEAESDAYWDSRPYLSRMGAVASRQSQPLQSRDSLVDAFQNQCKAHPADERIPRPATWGGYRIIPDKIEFWQGQSSRLHDRIRYTRQTDGSWTKERLAP